MGIGNSLIRTTEGRTALSQQEVFRSGHPAAKPVPTSAAISRPTPAGLRLLPVAEPARMPAAGGIVIYRARPITGHRGLKGRIRMFGSGCTGGSRTLHGLP
jgi:hypothetical protein